MPIDLSTATISNDGEAKPIYEGGVDLSTAYVSSSTIGSRKGLFRDYTFQRVLNKPIQVSQSDSFRAYLNKPITLGTIGDSDNLKNVLGDVKREKRLSSPDVFGQIFRSAVKTVVGLPKSAASWAGTAEESYFEEVQKIAEKVREKRAKPNYVKWLDLNQWEDEIMLQEAKKQAAYRKPVEIGGEVIEHRGFFDKVNEELNRFIENDLYTKPGTVNEWTDKLSSGLASIAISYSTFGIARALQAGAVIQALAPAGVIGAMAGGSAIEMGKEAGVDLDTRLRAGVKVALSEGAIEAVGFGFVMKYLKGGQPVVRIVADMVNNGLQEALQDLSSGAILKAEGISKQDWGEIFRGAIESAVVGFIVSAPFSAMTYRAQSKSLIGDFRKQGFSDAQMESAMETVFSTDPKRVQEKGDFAKVLQEKGFNFKESEKIENVIEKYGGEVELARMMKESPVGIIATKLIQRGFTAEVALEIADKSMEQIEERIIPAFAEDLQQMGEQVAEENAHTKIRLAFMERWDALGKPEGKDEQEWYEEGLATADIVAMKTIAEAKRRGIDPVELYISESPEIRREEDVEAVGLFQRGRDIEFTPEEQEVVKAIESGMSEEEFVNSKKIVYHGTGAQFDVFDDKMRGTITGAKSAQGAIWFTDNERVAKAYSVYAAETGEVKRLLDEAHRFEMLAQKTGKEKYWEQYNELLKKAEELDTYEANHERRKLANVKEAVLIGDFYEVNAQGKTPQELSKEGDIDSWLNEQIIKAKKLGKDGVVIKSLDDAVGLTDVPSTHYAVFSLKNILEVSEIKSLYRQTKQKLGQTLMQSANNLAEISRRFSDFVDSWARGEKQGQRFSFKAAPQIFKLLGSSANNIVVNSDVFDKAVIDKHKLSISDLKKIPAELSRPVLVYDSTTEKDAKVFLTQIKDSQGKDVVIAVHLKKSKTGWDFAKIASVYGKKDANEILKIIERKLPDYYDTKKTQDWLGNLASDTAKSVLRILSLSKVYTENDIKQGLFQIEEGNQQPRAMIDMTQEQGKRTIYLFKNADKSSLIHELGHDWFQRLFDYVRSGKADAQTMKYFETVRDWLGIEEGQSDLTVEQQERFAMGLERVLAEGDFAYGSEVASAFMAFRDWVRAVYAQTGLPGEELSSDVKEFFAWFLGAEKVDKPNRTREFIKGFSRGRVFGFEKAKEKLNPVIDALKIKVRTIKELQADLTNFINKELDLPAEDKAKFLTSIKRVTSYETMQKEVKEIVRRAGEYYDSNAKDELQTDIDKLLKKVTPKKEGIKTVGRYDYETNTFFDGYRKYSKMSKQEASLQLESEEMMTIDDVMSEQDKMRIRMLQLRAKGKQSSVELYSAVLSDIERAIHIGNTAKNEEDFMKRLNRKEAIDEALRAIEKTKSDKDSIKTKIVNLYRTGFSNIYSMLNSVMGKNLAEKYDPEILESEKETAIHFKTKQILSDIAKVFGVETRELNALFEKMAADKIEVSDVFDRVIELDRLSIVDIYLAIKNPTIMDRYVKTFGEETVLDLVGRLSDKEKAFGDILLEAVGEYYPVFNERNIEITARDLGRVGGSYWIATSEKPVDIYDEVIQSSEVYSAMKKRGGSGVIPKPVNALFKALKHIRAGEHIRYLSRRHEELKRILSDLKVKNLIENKFGSDVYHHMLQQLKNISLNKEVERTDAVSGVFSKILNKWVVAKIGINPSMFIKQLISVGNYMELIPVKEWTKYFFEGIMNPKETFDFMWKNAPFLEARFHSGYEEAVARAMEGAVNVGKLKENWAKALSALVRAGDIVAIVYGGYSVVKYYESQGKSTEEAVKIFQQQTLKAQQSGLSSGMAEFQNNTNPFARLFLAFQNTTFQYTRKQVDALISYSNGEISKLQLAKTLAVYGVIQPALYAFAGNFVREMYIGIGKALRGDPFDDEKEEGWFSGILEEILTAPFNAIPVINDLTKWAVKKMTGKKPQKVFNLALFDDIESSIRILNKQEISFADWLEIVGTPLELTTSAPIKTYVRMGKRFAGDGNKKINIRRAKKNMPTRKKENMPTRKKKNVPVRKKR